VQYLSTQVGAASSSSYDLLRSSAFIPVKTEKDVVLFKPSEVYFAKRERTNELYGSAFTFIDFGEKANSFLQYCGVRSEPSVKGEHQFPTKLILDIAWLLVREPEKTLRQAGSREKWVLSYDRNLMIGICNNSAYWRPIGSISTTLPETP
jgi:hypothetical protein